MKKIIGIMLLLISFLSFNFSLVYAEDSCTCTDGVVDSCPTTSLGAGIKGSNCTCSYGNDVMTCTDTAPTYTCTCKNGVVDSCPTTSLGAGIKGSNCTCSYGNDVISCTDTMKNCIPECTDGKQCKCYETGCTCETIESENNGTNSNTSSENNGTNSNTSTECQTVMGIKCCGEQLVNGQCKLNIYDTLGIRKSVRDTDDPTSVGLFVQDIVLSATFFIGTLVTVALIVSGIMFIFAASSGKDPANAKKGIMGSLVGLLLVVSSYVIIRLVQYIAKGF